MGTTQGSLQHASARVGIRRWLGLLAALSLSLPFVAAPASGWAEPLPTLEIGVSEMSDAVAIYGHDWPGGDVVVTVDDPATDEVEYTSDPPLQPVSGQFGTEVVVEGFGPDWVVAATDEVAEADITIPLLTVDRVDTATNTVVGTAAVGLTFDVDAIGGGQRVTAPTNDWSVPLPGAVSGGDVTATWSDLGPDTGDHFTVNYAWPTVDLWLSGGDEFPDEPPPNAWVYGTAWPEGATVHVELLDDQSALQWAHDYVADASGELRGVDEEVVTDVLASDVGAGWTVTADMQLDGWTVHKELDVAGVRVTAVDHVAGTASGPCTLPDGTMIGVELTRGVWPEGSEPLEVACTSGAWSAAWTVEPLAVPQVGASQRDGDWDASYSINWQDRPRVLHEATTGDLTLLFWHAEDLAILDGVDGPRVGTIPAADLGADSVQLRLADYLDSGSTLAEGSRLHLRNTTQLKTLELATVTIDAVDGSWVTGTAPQERDVRVQWDVVDVTVTSNANGDWSVDLGEVPNPGDVVRASLVDPDDDANIAEHQLPPEPAPPFVEVHLGGALTSPHPYIAGGGFDATASITVTVDKLGEADDETWSLPADAGEREGGWFFLESPFNRDNPEAVTIDTGDVVTVSDGTSTVTHTVQALHVDAIDTTADTVRMTTDATTSAVGVDGGGWYGDAVHVQAVADATAGTWTADFSGQLDILPYTSGIVNVEQGDGMTTMAWGAPFVAVGIDTRGQDGQGDDLWGGGWCHDGAVGVTVMRGTTEVWGPAAMTVGTEGRDGWCGFGFDGDEGVPSNLQVGDLVEVVGTTSGTTVFTTVLDLAVTDVVQATEASAGSVAGTADRVAAFPRLRVEAGGPSGWAVRWPAVSPADGGWSVDYDAEPQDFEEGALRIEPGTHGMVSLRAADGNLTFTHFGVDGGEPPTVFASAYGFEYVEGVGWDGLGPLTVDVDGAACDVTLTDVGLDEGDGHFFLPVDQFEVDCDLTPGDVITVTGTDGTTTSLTISDVVVTTVDPDGDVVSGTAAAESELVLQVGDQEPPLDIPTTADSDGNWEVHLGRDHGVELGPEGPSGAVYQWDDDGNATQSDWYVTNPVLIANPLQDFVVLADWPTGDDATLEVRAAPDGAVLHTQTVPLPGPYFVAGDVWIDDLGGFDLQVGHQIEVSIATLTRTFTVSPVQITDVDFAEATVSGIIEVGASGFVGAGSEFGECEAEFTDDDADGVWSVSLAAVCPGFDMGTHVEGAAGQAMVDDTGFVGVTIVFWSADHVVGSVDGGGSVSSGEGDVQPDDPVHATVTAPTSANGSITITRTTVTGTVSQGFVLLGSQVSVTGPTLSEGSAPYVLELVVDATVAPADIDAIEVLRDGVVVPDCPATPSHPCVVSRIRNTTTGDVTIRIHTLEFSTWTLGIRSFAAMAPLSGPSTPAPVGTAVDLSGSFQDSRPQVTHGALWDWGDGETTMVESVGLGQLDATHTYSSPGVYRVSLTVTASDGHAETRSFEYVVVYDPNGGFVTGGGWIDSPAGAYAADASLEGRATFGFVAKYHKGADIPDGNTEFQFRAGDLAFRSTSYDWLVVAGRTHAKFKGVGELNGVGGHAFMVTAVDGDPDTFRIKIWEETTGDVVYDNHVADTDGSGGTPLGGGSIVVHTTSRYR